MPRYFAGLALFGPVLLLGSALLAAPASARSNAAERAETRQLNREAAENARAHNSPAYTVKNAAANMPDNTPPAAAPTATVKVAATEPPAEPLTAGSTQPLTSVANPPDKIATANVFDRSGTLIGAVQKVELGAGGMPTDLNVALLGTAERIVTLDAARVQYDPSENRIVTDQSRAEILALPDAKPNGMQGRYPGRWRMWAPVS